MNKILLVGRLTKDVDTRYSQDGQTAISRFTVAVDRRYKKDNEQTADFISCIAFGKTAEFIGKYFTKGQRIGLEGRWQTGSYTNKEGAKVYTNDCAIESLEFAESKKAENNEPQISENGFVNIPEGIEEELPFN